MKSIRKDPVIRIKPGFLFQHKYYLYPDSFGMIRLKKKIVIAIDGFSSCGKSSFARLIARELVYIYLDSGAMYRSVALYGLQNGLIRGKIIAVEELISELNNIHIRFRIEKGENITYLNDENIELQIRGSEVSSVVSAVSKIPEVRNHLVMLQRQRGRDKGIVMDGRDIGTVVFPDAEVKIFMKAESEVRAERRYKELVEKGINSDLDAIRRNIQERDEQDINRDISPLRQAEDAWVLDNSHMTFEEQMDWFKSVLIKRDLLLKS